jgi:hypothetical protein
VNLREAARAFLEARGLFDAELGLCADRLFFAATREEKIACIGAWRCDAFVDDLAEVFSEPAFPKGVRRILYDRTGRRAAGPGVTACASWSQIRELLFPETP